MSLSTFSKFYYGFTVDADAYQIDFKEGGAELTAELNFGDYTLAEFLVEVKRALEAAGALTYTVSVARSTRIVTIAASGTFQLLTTSGTHNKDLFTLLGFSGADKTGTNTYTGGAGAGSSYTPQFKLQGYVGPDHYLKRNNPSVHESADGRVEVVSFGSLGMIEMEIRFATNIQQPSNGPVTNSQTGVADLLAFMTALITKAPVEFMPDSSQADTFYTIILESTVIEKNGTGFKLKERTDIGIPGYYDTDLLVFRVLE